MLYRSDGFLHPGVYWIILYDLHNPFQSLPCMMLQRALENLQDKLFRLKLRQIGDRVGGGLTIELKKNSVEVMEMMQFGSFYNVVVIQMMPIRMKFCLVQEKPGKSGFHCNYVFCQKN